MTLKKKILVAMLIVVAFFAIAEVSLAAVPCANGSLLAGQEAVNYMQSGKIKVDLVKISASQIRTTVTNNTDCQLPTSVNSYRVYDNVTFETQKQIDSTSMVMIAPRSSYSFITKMDSCLTQADAFYNLSGSPVRLLRGMIFGVDGGIFDSIPAAQGLFCTDNPPAQTLAGSCLVNPLSVNVGGNLSWGANASGGTGSYTYSWTGTDGLYGNSSTVSKSYGSAGTKTGTVTITSGSETVSYTCSGVVNQNITNNLSVSCDVDDSSVSIDEDVTFTAYASGGSGSYSYDWDGSENLYGSSRTVNWSYDNDGNKSATVIVTSGGQSATASCSVRVEEEEEDLDVSCYANPTHPRIGERMNWYVDVEGGDGDYDYDWTGTNNLDSSSEYPAMTYYTSGTKTATVRVRSDGQTETATCRAYVDQNTVLAYSQSNPNQVAGAVYLSQVPYTGVADDIGVIWFTLGLALFSAWIAYIVISYKKQVGELR